MECLLALLIPRPSPSDQFSFGLPSSCPPIPLLPRRPHRLALRVTSLRLSGGNLWATRIMGSYSGLCIPHHPPSAKQHCANRHISASSNTRHVLHTSSRPPTNGASGKAGRMLAPANLATIPLGGGQRPLVPQLSHLSVPPVLTHALVADWLDCMPIMPRDCIGDEPSPLPPLHTVSLPEKQFLRVPATQTFGC